MGLYVFKGGLYFEIFCLYYIIIYEVEKIYYCEIEKLK